MRQRIRSRRNNIENAGRSMVSSTWRIPGISSLAVIMLGMLSWPSCDAFLCSEQVLRLNAVALQLPRLPMASSPKLRSVAEDSSSSSFSSEEQENDSRTPLPSEPSTVEDLRKQVFQLYDDNQMDAAMKLLQDFQRKGNDDEDDETNSTAIAAAAFFKVFCNWLREMIQDGRHDKRSLRWATNMLEEFIRRGNQENSSWLPTADVFHVVVQSWTTATPTVAGASVECQKLIARLWSLYHQEKERQEQQQQEDSIDEERLGQFVPSRDTYFAAIRACSLRDRGVDAAKRAEALLDEMEALDKSKFSSLIPDRRIFNEVLNAWSKSGQPHRAGKRCETLLNRMIATAQNEERWRMTPDTVSFNIAISALAQGKERDSGSRSEALLFKMENLSSELGWECTSDNISFNSVINNWASSRSPGAAQRAMEIMDHMIRRYDRGVSSVTPDDITYSVVLKALSKSKHKHAIDQAEELFEDYRDAVEAGKWDLTHSALTWNSMINCYAKSRRQDAGQKAMELYKTMKSHAGKPGWERCNVDTYTYTSLIDAISKDESFESSEEAIRLLKEIEKSYAETNDQLFEPNILLYTAVVNAIGRSHKDPERAQKIVDRVESTYLQSVNTDRRPPTPDVSFYNALINAYGWSDMTGRSHKSFQVLQHMIDLSKGRDLPRARPDIISYNSVLNACAYEKTTSQADSDEIMKIVIEIFENLTSNTKRRGSPRPQPKTYTQVLIAISNHMPSDSEKKALLAEAVFFKCAEDGLVNPQVVMVLDGILPKSRFQDIMGDALNKELHDSGKLGFDLKNLPLEWTKNSRERGPPNQSLKTKDGFQVTKNVQSKLSKEKAKAYQ